MNECLQSEKMQGYVVRLHSRHKALGSSSKNSETRCTTSLQPQQAVDTQDGRGHLLYSGLLDGWVESSSQTKPLN